MLSDNDMAALAAQLSATAEVLGQSLSDHALALMVEDLAAFDLHTLTRALARLRREAGKLSLRAVLDSMDALSGRPEPNEAWALAIRALDERETVVWTDEIAQAWAVALPIAQTGDKVGARMAFLAAYERIVRNARDAHKLPLVQVSEGWDAAGREQALSEAVTAGLLTAEQAAQHRPALEAPVFNPVPLLTSDLREPVAAPPDVKARFEQLRRELRERQEAAERARLAARQAQQAEWDERKRRAAALAHAAMREQPQPPLQNNNQAAA